MRRNDTQKAANYNFENAGLNQPTHISFDTAYSPTGSETVGTRFWNAVKGTTTLITSSGSALDDGQELRYYGKASGDVLNGQLVQFAGSQGDHALFKVAVPAEIIANPMLLMGVATEDIANGDFGNVTLLGYVNDVTTYAWATSDLLWFDNLTGQLTNVEPEAPDRRILIAAVVKEETGSAENGVLLVRISWGMRLTELEDVDGGTPSTGDYLKFDGTKWTPSPMGGSGGSFQRVLSSSLVLADGESLAISGYINAGSYDVTLNGDAVVQIL